MKKKLNSAGLLVSLIIVSMIFVYAPEAAAQNNELLAKKVTAAITSEYPPENVIITVKGDGWVILNGKADLLYNKDMMYELAAHVYGVKRITNDIDILPETTEGDDDPNTEPGILPNDIIKENVINLLERNPDIKEPEKIEVNVDNALVMLSGRVHFYKEKILAQTAASQVNGVQAIQNNITVVPLKKAETDEDIRDVLISVINKDFPLVDRNEINLKVDNGTATVWGAVSNLWIKDSIEKEFSSVDGVKGVINNLKIVPEMGS
jgi:osmotically-inducible protein OsmY